MKKYSTLLPTTYYLLSILFVFQFSLSAFADTEKINELWKTEGFSNPESVVYDKTTDALYVSNVNGSAMEKDGNGFISKVALDGKILKLDWATGLNAPKGLAIYDGKLYTADIDTLVESI